MVVGTTSIQILLHHSLCWNGRVVARQAILPCGVVTTKEARKEGGREKEEDGTCEVSVVPPRGGLDILKLGVGHHSCLILFTTITCSRRSLIQWFWFYDLNFWLRVGIVRFVDERTAVRLDFLENIM